MESQLSGTSEAGRLRRAFLLVLAIGLAPLISKVLTTSQRDGPAQKVSDKLEPYRFSFHELKAILMGAFNGLSSHNDSLLAAGVAFYALFALFPALAAATWFFGLFADPAMVKQQLDNLRNVLPKEAWTIIDQQLTLLIARSTSFSIAGFISLLVALYSARLAASSMMGALNEVYGIEETRNFVVTNAIAMLFTLLAIFILLAAAGVMVVLPVLFNFMCLHSLSAAIVSYVRWPALAVIMGLALAVLYRYGPDRENARWKWLTWGSGTATLLWLLASLGFAWYVSAFNSYDKIYGSIGAVVVLLFWFWITAFLGLLGAELDNVIERRRGIPPK